MARTARASRSRSRGSTRTRTSARNPGVIEVFTRPQTHPVWRVLGLVVRLRAELTLLAVLITTHTYVWQPVQAHVGYWPSVIGLVILLGIVFGVPASRRALTRRWWCVTTRHRIRACYSQTRTMTHHGRMPLLVWSRPSPVGERVRVWLPAGLSVKDLERVTAETAAACWASDVRVTPSRRQAALVVVDVIRRDPLTGGALTPTVVDDLDPTGHGDPLDLDDDIEAPGTGGTVVPLPTRSTLPPPTVRDLPDTGTTSSTSTTTGQNGSRTRTRKTPAPAGTAGDTASEPPVTGFGGVDVSDYV